MIWVFVETSENINLNNYVAVVAHRVSFKGVARIDVVNDV